jgi:transposase
MTRKAREKKENENDQTPQTAEIENLKRRRVEMFKMHLLNYAPDEVAKEFSVSVATVYRIMKQDNWKAYKARLDKKDHQDAFDEVRQVLDQEKQESKTKVFQHPDGRYYFQVELISPSRHFGVIPPDPKVCELVEENGKRYFRYFCAPPGNLIKINGRGYKPKTPL